MTTAPASPVEAVHVPDLDLAILEIREYDRQRTRYIDAMEENAFKVAELLARGVSERDGDTAAPGTPLFDSRVFLGLDGATGARDIRAEADHG